MPRSDFGERSSDAMASTGDGVAEESAEEDEISSAGGAGGAGADSAAGAETAAASTSILLRGTACFFCFGGKVKSGE